MKKLLLILLFLPLMILAQTKDEQVVVEYSLKYKTPFEGGILGMMKKMAAIIISETDKPLYDLAKKNSYLAKKNSFFVPNLCVMYFAPDVCRIELDGTDLSIFGKRDKEALIIKNYNKSELFIRSKGRVILASHLTDLIKNTDNLMKRRWLYDKYELFIDTGTSLTYLNETKEIKLNIRGNELMKEAVKFDYENKNEKGTGYILKDISAIGALVDGQDYGLPISYAIYNKKTNITAIYECIGFRIEDIDHDLYKSSIWKY